ncbi:MAG: NAD(P)-dependent alcohol dehydrogenase [Acidobacteriota bacterium]|nr:NAD(P)-dependent alcohol dehydrogenase [Acidobacteriota bacterium]MDH3785172.1 NAD(P)-dependent alcohol dehydrogenase [Acidobacteriota bacterium]
MKAVVHTEYGPPEVLTLREVVKPTPGAKEVLIRIAATTVNTGDCEMRRSEIPNVIWFIIRLFFGLTKPRKQILGAYFSGEIEAVGSDVEQFQVGDQVFAASGVRFGAYAEYVCLPSRFTIATKPTNMTHKEASAVPLGGLNAWHYLQKAKIRKGEKVLINGAGGAFGTFAVQLAKLMGATVTGVDSTEKLDMLRELGADHVIDYTQEDYTDNGETYDVIFNVVAKSSLSRGIRTLNSGGRYLLTNPAGLFQMFRAPWISMTSDKDVIVQFAPETVDELNHLRELIESGKLRSIIDRSFPLEQAVEAHHYVESGRKKGNVVLTMGPA